MRQPCLTWNLGYELVIISLNSNQNKLKNSIEELKLKKITKKKRIQKRLEQT